MRPNILIAFAFTAALLLNGCSKKPAPNTQSATQPSDQQNNQQPQGVLNSDGTYSPAPNQPSQPQNPTPNPAQNPPQNAAQTTAQNQTPNPPPPPPGAPQQNPAPVAYTLPHGTPIHIRITERLSASHNEIGDRFTGVLAEPILGHSPGSQDSVVFARGTHVAGTVVAVRGRGTFSGSGALGIRLTSIADHPIRATEFEQTAKGNGKHTAGFIGGGAGLGAVLGAIAGGGRGALIGGVVGASAGTAGAAYTGKHDVIIPSESRITFRLTEPVTVP